MKLREIARNLHSLLVLQNKTIVETEIILQTTGVEIDRVFDDRRLKTKVKELSIKVADKEAGEMLNLLKDLSITEATGLLYGLDNEIKGKLREDNKTKKLEELKLELL